MRIQDIPFKPNTRVLIGFTLSMFLLSCGDSKTPSTDNIEPLPVADTRAPEADVLFPWGVSRTTETMITVKGTASDQSGVDDIVVNDITATLFASEDKKSLDWQVEIPATKNIIVQSKDIHGNISNEAAKLELITGDVPRSFVIDDVNQRLIGVHDDNFKLMVMDCLRRSECN